MSNNTNTCPRCGHSAEYYDKVLRIVRTKRGKKYWQQVPRLRCLSCGHIHRTLPDTLIPFKHYERDIIDGFVSGTLSQSNLDFEDYPCDATISKWKGSQKLHLLLRRTV